MLLLLACTGTTTPTPDETGAPNDSEVVDDTDGAVDEVCNGVDDDGDGLIDEDAVDASAWYADEDGDGYGTGAATLACEPPSGHVSNAEDCDDTDATVAPSAEEVCGDEVDQDCDGTDLQCAELGIPGAIAEFAGSDDDGLGVTLCPGTGDFNGDDAPDIAIGAPIAGTGGEARVFSGPFGGEITDATSTMASATSNDQLPRHCAVVADLDGAGTSGLWLYGASSGNEGRGELSLHLAPLPSEMTRGTAEGLWTVGSDGEGTVWDMAVGDLDHDGLPDLLLGTEADNGLGAMFLVQGAALGSGAITELPVQMEFAGGLAGEHVATGDLNGDGVSDLVAFSPHNSWTLVRFGPVESSFDEAADIVAGGVQVTELVVGDVDGDGLDDLVLGEYTHNGSRGRVVLLESPQPTEPFNAPQEASAVITPEDGDSYLATSGRLAAGDLDGDGSAEILVGAELSGDGGAAWLFQQPVEGSLDTSAAAWEVSGTDEWTVARLQVAGDTNGDGAEEFLVTGIGSGDVVDRVWLLSP